MFLCSHYTKTLIAVGLALLGLAPTSVLAQEGGRSDPVICLPNASGDGWNCRKDDGARPDVKRVAERSAQGRAVEAARKKRNQEEQTRRTATEQGDRDEPDGIESVASPGLKARPATSMMGDDPADWYQESQPRPTDNQHQLKQDLSASYFVVSETTGLDKCEGAYVTREYPHAVGAPNDSFVVTAQADRLSSIIDKSVSLVGNVTIEQGNRLIHASQAELDQDS